MKLKTLGMRSWLALAAAALTAALGSDAARAATEDVQIKFTGRYVPLSCTVQAGAETMTVTLPTVSVQSLSAPGNTAGSTRFEIPIECVGTPATVRAYFQSGPTSDMTGRLNPQAVSPGVAAQGVPNTFVFSIDQNNNKQTVSVGPGWTMPAQSATSGCWVRTKGGLC